uniref:Uncharacterized protein n=1 Tax=Lotus japonicus TaxID=34305 RepID=I3SZU5_LOTJA|nr:unknown [Lotus japonicus]
MQVISSNYMYPMELCNAFPLHFFYKGKKLHAFVNGNLFSNMA